MWSTSAFISVLLALAPLSAAKTKPVCPTVTTTNGVCTTCVRTHHHCFYFSTVTNPTNCPTKVATVTDKYPCAKSKCPSSCVTRYTIVSPTSVKPTSTTTAEVTAAASPCPTVTSVLGHCSTCAMPQCELLSTIKSQCGCPSAVPTVTTSYNCEQGCVGGCAGTQYVYDTAKPTCTSKATKY